jgi:hypothetical protein
MAADLHVHSTASDGCLAPAELVDLAKSQGLTALAVTDHDTTEGVAPAARRGDDIGVLVVSGVEISCAQSGEEYHLLGYRLDTAYPPLVDRLARLRDSRERRLEQIVARLAAEGVHVEAARIRQLAGHGSVGRPHVADALIERGYVQNRLQAFQYYLAKGRPGYVPREKVRPEEAIAVIRAARGVAVWAHPGNLASPEALTELQAKGLWGIEVWHPDHSDQQVRKLLPMAEQFGLYATGGSDYHCDAAGGGLGCRTTSDYVLSALLAAP